MFKIFLIGFNKCGTSSFHEFFKGNGFKSVHCKIRVSADEDQYIASIIHTNFMLGRKLLYGIDSWDVYGDMTFSSEEVSIEGVRFFRELYHQYPDSKFILNTRNVNKWLDSRFSHGNFAARCASSYGCTMSELRGIWAKQYEAHHKEVRDFFLYRPGSFLDFNIEEDSISSLIKFMEPIGPLDKSKWKPHNVSGRKGVAPKMGTQGAVSLAQINNTPST